MIFVIIFAWVFSVYICFNYGEYIDPRYFKKRDKK